MPDKDDLDLLLDSALATYGSPGPETGLEQRVLSSLAAARAAEQERRARTWSRRWLAWAIAVPVAASLLLWIGISRTVRPPAIRTYEAHHASRTQTAHEDKGTNEQRLVQKGRPSGAKAHREVAAAPARLKSCPVTKPGQFAKTGNVSISCPAPAQADSSGTQVAQSEPSPKLDVFPTPQALTPQERALAVVAMQSPVPVRKALAAAQEQDDIPVHIAAIHIPPIDLQSQTEP